MISVSSTIVVLPIFFGDSATLRRWFSITNTVRRATVSQRSTVPELRRLVPRQFADWRGTYVIDSDPDVPWRSCRVIDISPAGAGIELVDAPSETRGHRILVAVHLQAEIRNAAPTKTGHVRVGAQFVNPTLAEQSYLESQQRLAVH